MSHDLISRKALVAALIKEREQYPFETAERYSFGVKLPNRFNQAMRGGIHKALRLVETAPAIDAEPVWHGRWIKRKNTTFDCSECGVVTARSLHVCEIDEAKLWNYCPLCGAKMDLEVQ